jgi:hypothetical protein
LDWQPISVQSETRCYVKDKKLVAISQYYTDLSDCYKDPKSVYVAIMDFFDGYKSQMSVDDCIMDLNVVESDNDNKVSIIELNNYGFESDPCLFEWGLDDDDKGKTGTLDTLTNCIDNETYKPPFRYLVNGKLVTHTPNK